MPIKLYNKSAEIGFDVCNIIAPELPATAGEGLQGFLDNNHHGDMLWMEEKLDRRADPKTLWPDVKSIIMLGHNYAPETNPLHKLEQKTIGNISCYALNQDYHDVIKKKLKQLARWVAAEYGCEVKVFVDTAPVMEKPLAAAAGIGWQGKHTCLVSREFGSWLFLGSIFTSLVFEPSPSGRGQGEGLLPHAESSPLPSTHTSSLAPQGGREFNGCGSCRSCLDICPTQAFTAERELDARKCISYLTIEHKGQIPLEYRKAIGNRIYGCDDCLAICPWNKFAQTSREIAYHTRKDLEAPLLADLLQLDDAAFRALFSKSPVKRIGRDRFIRNVLIAAGNSDDKNIIPQVKLLLNDESKLVREMASWALEELQACPI